MKIRNADFLILIGNNAEPFFLKNIVHHLKKNIELSTINKIKLFLIYNSKNLIDKKRQKNTLQKKKKLIIYYMIYMCGYHLKLL